MDIENLFLISDSLAILAMKNREIAKFQQACVILQDYVKTKWAIDTPEYNRDMNEVISSLIEKLKKVISSVNPGTKDFNAEDIAFVRQCVDVCPLTEIQKTYRRVITNYFLGGIEERNAIKAISINECPVEMHKELLAIKLVIANDDLDYSEIANLITEVEF